jgi:hypothetical protein
MFSLNYLNNSAAATQLKIQVKKLKNSELFDRRVLFLLPMTP